MSQCYSTFLCVRVKENEMENLVKALQGKIAQTDEDKVNYHLESESTADLDGLMRIMFAACHGGFERVKDTDNPLDYSCSNNFSTCYGWEMVMNEWFEIMARYLEPGSYLEIMTESRYKLVVGANGKLAVEQPFDLHIQARIVKSTLTNVADEICAYIKGCRKDVWNFVNEDNIDRDTLFAYSFVPGNNNLQEVRLCALRVRVIENDYILDGLFLPLDYTSLDEPLTDQEVINYLDGNESDLGSFVRINNLASAFDGKMTLLSLIDNLSSEYYTL